MRLTGYEVNITALFMPSYQTLHLMPPWGWVMVIDVSWRGGLFLWQCTIIWLQFST